MPYQNRRSTGTKATLRSVNPDKSQFFYNGYPASSFQSGSSEGSVWAGTFKTTSVGQPLYTVTNSSTYYPVDSIDTAFKNDTRYGRTDFSTLYSGQSGQVRPLNYVLFRSQLKPGSDEIERAGWDDTNMLPPMDLHCLDATSCWDLYNAASWASGDCRLRSDITSEEPANSRSNYNCGFKALASSSPFGYVDKKQISNPLSWLALTPNPSNDGSSGSSSPEPQWKTGQELYVAYYMGQSQYPEDLTLHPQRAYDHSRDPQSGMQAQVSPANDGQDAQLCNVPNYTFSAPSMDSGYASHSYLSNIASTTSHDAPSAPSRSSTAPVPQSEVGRKRRRTAQRKVITDESTETTTSSSSASLVEASNATFTKIDQDLDLILAGNTYLGPTKSASQGHQQRKETHPISVEQGTPEVPAADSKDLDPASWPVDVVQDTEGDVEENSDSLSDTYDRPDDINEYAVAFIHFGLRARLHQYERKHPEDIVEGGGGAKSGTGTSLVSTNSSATSGWSGSTSTTNQSATSMGSGSSDRSGMKVAAATSGRFDPEPKPLDLVCWHAASGIRCKQQTRRSPESRRLSASV